MYMMRRVHAEQNSMDGSMNVWVYQGQKADLNKLIATAKFNLDPFKEVPDGSMWEDLAPDQNMLPGCVWQGRVDQNLEWNGPMIHVITHCLIFNISKCWYSPVLSRDTTDGDRAISRINCKFGDDVYPSVTTIKDCVDYLTSPAGIRVCCDRDIKPLEVPVASRG